MLSSLQLLHMSKRQTPFCCYYFCGSALTCIKYYICQTEILCWEIENRVGLINLWAHTSCQYVTFIKNSVSHTSVMKVRLWPQLVNIILLWLLFYITYMTLKVLLVWCGCTVFTESINPGENPLSACVKELLPEPSFQWRLQFSTFKNADS